MNHLLALVLTVYGIVSGSVHALNDLSIGLVITGDDPSVTDAVNTTLQEVSSETCSQFPPTLTSVEIMCNSSAVDVLQSVNFDAIFGLVDFGCPETSEVLYSVASYLRKTVISSRTTFATNEELRSMSHVFRVVPSERQLSPAVTAVIKEFGWSRVTLITQELPPFLERHLWLYDNLTAAEISVIDTVKFDIRARNLTDSVNDVLESSESHIFLLNTNKEGTLWFLCTAYAQGTHYPNYEWITLGSFENQWWRQYGNFLQEISCTDPDNIFNTMLNRALVLLPYPDEQVQTFENLFNTRQYTQDAALGLSLALDNCINSIGCLNCANLTCLGNCSDNLGKYITHYNGSTGNVSFTNDGERVFEKTLLLQYQQHSGSNNITLTVIGSIESRGFSFITNDTAIWPDGIPPDGTPVEIVHGLNPAVVGLCSFLIIVAGAFIIVCFLFNIVFRQKKIVKLTSPNLNLLMIFGTLAVLASTIPVQATSITPQLIKCTIDRMASSWGYDTCIAITLVKTWRIYYIFKKSKTSVKKTNIQDWKLILIVIGIVSVDVVFTVPFMIAMILMDDAAIIEDTSQPSDKNEQGVTQNYFVAVCGQTILYQIWVAAIIIYKLFLHGVGLVLAFLTRNIEIDALNDSKYSAAMTYCSSFILILLIFTVPATANNPNLEDSSYCILIFLLIVMFLGFTFIPKMRALYKDPEGKNIIGKAGKSASQLGKDKSDTTGTSSTGVSSQVAIATE